MKKKILVISGGISKERVISLQTGRQVANELKKNGYEVKISEPDFNLLDIIKKFKPRIIFNALHGQFGEDGYIQSILENINLPYTHSGFFCGFLVLSYFQSRDLFEVFSTRSEESLSIVVLADFVES